MVTIEEVAKYAGVSVATVSRTLNGSSTVKPDTAKRVMAAVNKLNYIPNQSARNLRRNESRVILALAPNFSNPYYSRILSGMGDVAREREYSVLFCNTSGQAERERHFLSMLDKRRADGAVLLGCNKEDVDYGWLSSYTARFPVVLCCEYIQSLDCPTVSIDNYKAAYETVEYLLQLGHRRIAMLGAENGYISTVQRRRGYLDALAACDIVPPAEYMQCADADYSFASGQAAAKKLLHAGPRPTAVFCMSDILALSVISEAQNMGLKVPEDLTVTGFDDVDYTTMFHPFLTTVAQPCYEMGRMSISRVLDMLQEEDADNAHRCFLQHRLVCRESSSAPGGK